MKQHLVTALLCLGVLLTACERQPPTAAIQPALTGSESFQVVGDYEMHYNAVRTDQLTADIARAYGIERSKNKVLLNISVLHKNADGGTTASDASIDLAVHNLNGQTKQVALRRIAESNAIYYIAEAPFSGAETLVFVIKALPNGSTTVLEATLTREFFAN